MEDLLVALNLKKKKNYAKLSPPPQLNKGGRERQQNNSGRLSYKINEEREQH